MKTFIFSATIIFASVATSVANAQVVFDVIAGDAVTTFSNPDNATPSLATTPPTATLTGSAGLAHMIGNVDIQTLNGGTSITSTDVITLTWVVDSITGYTNPDDPAASNNPNGIEFGLVPNVGLRSTTDNVGTLSRFRADSPNIVNANRLGNGFGNLFAGGPGQTENVETVEGPGLEATAESFADGFTVVQTITADGVITQYSDIVVTDALGTPNDGTVITAELQPFVEGTNFVDFINGAHFYAGSDSERGLGTGAAITFSTAQIEISTGTNTTLLGDVDLSNTVDFLDIGPFVTILTTGGSQLEADIDMSGDVDFLDIAPFVAILLGSGS